MKRMIQIWEELKELFVMDCWRNIGLSFTSNFVQKYFELEADSETKEIEAPRVG